MGLCPRLWRFSAVMMHMTCSPELSILHSCRLTAKTPGEHEHQNSCPTLRKKLNNPKLSNLAYRVRLDAFTRVKKAIDDMVAQLLKEKADEIKHKDFCTDEFNTNQLQTESEEREKQNKEFRSTVADQRETQKLLQAALGVLQD